MAKMGFLHLPKTRNKNILIVILFGVSLLQLYYLNQLPKPNEQVFNQLIILENEEFSSSYNDLFKSFPIKELVSKTLNQRCNLYFNNLYSKDESWKIDPKEEFDYDKSVFNKNIYIASKIREIKKVKAKEGDHDIRKIETTDEIRKLAEVAYNEKWDATMKVEQRLINSVAHLRNFGNCYINEETSSSKRSIKPNKIKNGNKANNELDINGICSDIESRIFPWLSRGLPVFKRWDGETVIGFPKMSDYIDYDVKDVINLHHDHAKPKPPAANAASKSTTSLSSLTKKFNLYERDSNEPCYLTTLKKSFNGKGIILTISDNHVEDVYRLIYLLRGLNNKLPIQIIYQDNLSPTNIQSLIIVARNDLNNIPESFVHIEHLVGIEFPPQEVWFVSAANSIQSSYRGKFGGFGNKFLALLFSSFEENLLIDSDTVLFQKPNDFFNLQNYTTTGSFFFKDRSLTQSRGEQDLNFFKKLLPSKIDELLFGVPATTKFTTGNNFFKGMDHYMESGVVVINKKQHFLSILMMVQLFFWSPTSMRVYGDKELFWLGSSIAGDENYHFNHYAAASIGVLTPPEERTNPQKTYKSNEVCSNHPGHISEEDGQTLLWMNSGYKFCKKDIGNDFSIKKQRMNFLKTPEDMKNFYNSKTKITHAIIPPAVLGELNKFNSDGEPSNGWHKYTYCEGYYYCAFDRIGGEDDEVYGKLVEFDNSSIALFDYYGDLWIQDWRRPGFF